jgi:hypothetical protein
VSAQLLPHVPTVFCNLVYTRLFACDWSNYEADFARLMRMVEDETRPDRAPPRYLCVQPLQARPARRGPVGPEAGPRLLKTVCC